MGLSKAQSAMLKRLQGGERIMVVKGIDAHAFWRASMGTANISTVFALEARGLIRRSAEDWRGWTVEPQVVEPDEMGMEASLLAGMNKTHPL